MLKTLLTLLTIVGLLLIPTSVSNQTLIAALNGTSDTGLPVELEALNGTSDTGLPVELEALNGTSDTGLPVEF